MTFQRRSQLCEDKEARRSVMSGEQADPLDYSTGRGEGRGEDKAVEEADASATQKGPRGPARA